MRVCSVSVDLMRSPATRHPWPEARLGVPFQSTIWRSLALCDFAASLALPLTLFVIARDLDREQNVAALTAAVARGHEIGNHSL